MASPSVAPRSGPASGHVLGLSLVHLSGNGHEEDSVSLALQAAGRALGVEVRACTYPTGLDLVAREPLRPLTVLGRADSIPPGPRIGRGLLAGPPRTEVAVPARSDGIEESRRGAHG